MELELLNISKDVSVKKHNVSGCDLCNRTGISGRTLLLDALLINLGPSERNDIYKALLHNVNDLLGVEGVIVHTRKEGLIDLVTSGLIDPRSALSYIES